MAAIPVPKLRLQLTFSIGITMCGNITEWVMADDQSRSGLDIVAAILSHVSLMIAGIAFIYQLSDRINADLYSTSRINSVLSSGNVQAARSTETEHAYIISKLDLNTAEKRRVVFGEDSDFYRKYILLTPNQKIFADYFTSAIDLTVCFILLFYLAIAILCLNSLRIADRFSDTSIYRLVTAAKGTTLLSILLIMTMMLSSPIFARLG